MPDAQPVTTDFILTILGAKVIELEALRIRVAQLEQQANRSMKPVSVENGRSVQAVGPKEGG